MTVVPDDYFEARQMTFFVGNTPVFYWPFYRRSLKQHPNNFEFVPGDRSIFGPYLLSSYNWYGNGLLDGTIHLDERERRGLATGPDLMLHMGDWGEAAFRYYYAHDLDPNADGVSAPHLNNNRQHSTFLYDVNPTTNLSAKIVANYQSDPLVVRDFWEGQYQANVEPASFGEIQQVSPNWILDTMVQPQVSIFLKQSNACRMSVSPVCARKSAPRRFITKAKVQSRIYAAVFPTPTFRYRSVFMIQAIKGLAR